MIKDEFHLCQSPARETRRDAAVSSELIIRESTALPTSWIHEEEKAKRWYLPWGSRPGGAWRTSRGEAIGIASWDEVRSPGAGKATCTPCAYMCVPVQPHSRSVSLPDTISSARVFSCTETNFTWSHEKQINLECW